MPFLIGTAGHVDHGKTALIRALTGIDADRLPEEQKRGMTIDLGFAYIDLMVNQNLERVSIVDVPGHQKFLSNMLVGALGMDIAMLCVAADEGVMLQTVEHFEILSLLRVQSMIVVITRADIASPMQIQESMQEVGELIANTKFADAEMIATSAHTGQGLEELKSLIAKEIWKIEEEKTKNVSEESKADAPWYLPIDRVFIIPGSGVVVTGTLAQGTVRVGEPATIMPENLGVKIRAIQAHGMNQQQSAKGTRTALNLSGVKIDQLRRGQVVGHKSAVFATQIIDARMKFISEPKHAQRVRISIGAEEVIAKQFLNEYDRSLVQYRLGSRVAVARDQPLIVRHHAEPRLIGGGFVITAVAKQRRKNEKPIDPAAIIGNLEQRIVQVVSQYETGLSTDEIARHLSSSAQELGQPLENLKKNRSLFGFAGVWLSPASLLKIQDSICVALKRLHDENPMKLAIPKDQVLKAAQIDFSQKSAERLIQHLSEMNIIVQHSSQIRLPEFRIKLTARQRELLDQVLKVMAKHGSTPPTATEIAREIHVPPQAVAEIFQLGQSAGEIVRIADGIYYSNDQLNRIKELIRRLASGGAFTAAEFRDSISATRKFAIPLLEYFDATRFTLRQGDHRVLY